MLTSTHALTNAPTKTRQAAGWLTSLLFGLLLAAPPGYASDIDIYSGLSSATGAPNLLIVMDNAADFTSNYGGLTPCGYTDSATTPGLAGKNGSVEQCALNNVINALPVNADGTARINVGIMVYNSKNLATAYGCNSSGAGGCLVFPMQPMNAAGKASIMSKIKSWTSTNIGANNEATGSAMQEAWAYLSGSTGMSGTKYTSPVSASGCQRNYVVFVANALTTNGSPGDASAAPGTSLNTTVTTRVDPTTGAVALTSAQQAIYSPAFIQLQSGTYGINGVFSCSPNPYVMKSTDHTQISGLYADEWALYMYGTDLFTGAMPAAKNITTYSIGVLSSSCTSTYPALLSSMANNGNGKYYAVQTADDLSNALNSILNEVQAVNSVFSSATLPVSVNTQGTYLNQIYMGMFRPDPNAKPRWIGNVKQYQFQLDQQNNLYLADATSQPAISATTGFVTPGAASFWSCTYKARASTLSGPGSPYTNYSALTYCAGDPAPGFFVRNFPYANFSQGKAWDMMDGEIVEKGGASQSIRLENLNDDYTQNAGTSANPRRLYTLCPGGLTSCTCQGSGNPTASVGGSTVCAALYDPINSFGANNSAIPTTAFGGQSAMVLASLTRSGTTATATTATAHNWASGQAVTISGASPKEYNGTFSITVASPTTFTYQMVEYPPLISATSATTPLYQMQAHMANLQLAGMTRTATAGANPSPNPDLEYAIGWTAAPNGFQTGNQVIISGGNSNENAYNGLKTITVLSSTQFYFPVAITPPATSANTYSVALHSPVPVTISTISTKGSTATVTTATAHGFKNGDFIQISNTGQSCLNTAGVTISVTGTYTFTYSGVSGSCPNTNKGSALQVATAQTIGPGGLTRIGTTNTATAVATVNNSQFATGDTVDITYVSGTATNETRYVGTFTITCLNTGCTSFSFTVSTGPQYAAASTLYAALSSGAVNVTGLTRGSYGSTTATATLAAVLPGYVSGGQVDVFAAPGVLPPPTENGYQGTFTATCGSTCATIIYSPITLTPVSPASGNIQAYNPSVPPSPTSLINWVRGQDNMGDEASLCPPGTTAGTAPCPAAAVTVRPSIHGDALHSRPIAVNYGGTTGVVVYYGTNDGVYHAINGNQSAAIGTVPPGDEMWGFIAPDFFPKLPRQMNNTPQLMMPDTPATGITPTPQPKDYFIDGPTGLLQRINSSNQTYEAVIYIGGRRGGHVLYAVDVTDPTKPWVRWKIDNSSPGMSELGQVWSLPKVARVKGYTWTNPTTGALEPKPVIIIGGGYDDGSEDQEPPVSATLNGGGVDEGSDNTGRAIFILDAMDGHVVWQANHYNLTATAWADYWTRAQNGPKGGVCNGIPPASVTCDVYGFNYSVPADVTLVDRDTDGLIDRLYATDTGGNVWRVDLEPAGGATPDFWQLTQLAALGCSWGPCDTQLNGNPTAANPATTQRKFFFPAEVVAATSGTNYDAVYIGSGDREHPLMTAQAYNVTNRMYMIKDLNTGKDSSSQVYPITETNVFGASLMLDDCTGANGVSMTGTCAPTGPNGSGAASALPYCQLTQPQQHGGYFFTLGTGEKCVNAPMVAAGYVYFGTNQPAAASTTNTCTTNLGISRGYQLSTDACGRYASVVFTGGGLPPSPVSGIVNIDTATGPVSVPFCVGCPSPLTGGTNNCADSALGACKPAITVPPIRHRNYWSTDFR